MEIALFLQAGSAHRGMLLPSCAGLSCIRIAKSFLDPVVGLTCGSLTFKLHSSRRAAIKKY